MNLRKLSLWKRSQTKLLQAVVICVVAVKTNYLHNLAPTVHPTKSVTPTLFIYTMAFHLRAVFEIIYRFTYNIADAIDNRLTLIRLSPCIHLVWA